MAVNDQSNKEPNLLDSCHEDRLARCVAHGVAECHHEESPEAEIGPRESKEGAQKEGHGFGFEHEAVNKKIK